MSERLRKSTLHEDRDLDSGHRPKNLRNKGGPCSKRLSLSHFVCQIEVPNMPPDLSFN